MIPYKSLSHLLPRYISLRLKRKPYVINIEVTHRCIAKCAHCSCWKVEPEEELPDYADIIRRFRPCVVWLTGGEPLVRNDLVRIVRRIRETDPYLYLGIATNGWLLNPDLGQQLAEAGLDQVNISLDFIGRQHDDFRQIDGLYQHIERIVPELKKTGLCVVLACCIMRRNIDSLLPIARLAEEWDIEVGYSCYSPLKTGEKDDFLLASQIGRISQIIQLLCDLKKSRGVVKSSLSYLKRIPFFFERGTLGTCDATKTWLYVTPDGHLKICPDKPNYAHYKDYSGSLNISCGECWYTCRGEMETTLLERLIWEARHGGRKRHLMKAAPGP